METDTFSIAPIFDRLRTHQKIISIIGLEKNVGKTTLLNALLKGMAERGFQTLVLSIGRDGEQIDALEKTRKPGILIYKGSCFISIGELIKRPSAVEILEVFDEKVSGSKLILARALQNTQVQLINPGDQKRLNRIIRISIQKSGSHTVFIDGALDRLSHGSSTLIDGVFVCTGVQVEGSLPQVIEKTKTLIANLENQECAPEIREIIRSEENKCGSMIVRNHRMNSCIPGAFLDTKELDEKIKNNDIIYTAGVLTDAIIKRFIDKDLKVTVVLMDGTKCQVSQRYRIKMIRKGILLRVLNTIPVYGLSVNSIGIRRSMNPSKVLTAFQESFKDKWVFDTTYPA